MSPGGVQSTPFWITAVDPQHLSAYHLRVPFPRLGCSHPEYALLDFVDPQPLSAYHLRAMSLPHGKFLPIGDESALVQISPHHAESALMANFSSVQHHSLDESRVNPCTRPECSPAQGG